MSCPVFSIAPSLEQEFSGCLFLQSLHFESSLWYLAKMPLAAVEACSWWNSILKGPVKFPTVFVLNPNP